MTTQVVLPKLGNSVESSIIVAWLKQPGDRVEAGEPICTVETDKSTLDVPSTASGVLLQHLVNVGDDVPVQTPIALIGEAATPTPEARADAPPATPAISPRALKLAQEHNIDPSQIVGSGPGGRIIERDVRAQLEGQREARRMTPVARAMVARGGYVAPEQGSGPGGRITKHDLIPIGDPAPSREPDASSSDYEVIPLSGIRRAIAERMRASLQSTAQLTLHTSADARALLAYRQKLKASDESLGLRNVTINDLVMFAVARTLRRFPALNATFEGSELRQHARVHLGFAVDTPRGLLAPVIRDAHALSLRQLAEAAKALVADAAAGKLSPDVLAGGTFTVTNLGSLGVESFTPILNPPQVAILGVGSVNLKPILPEGARDVVFAPHLGLSLTVDHQFVDGAPAARFLQALAHNIEHFELLLAT
ncbi:MAG: 2-oxo acid dehydrogenase subunit E2 [Chloroflexi bacterium]|jgi:pyruvate dehydrogenase E2 component (dihydrolipoamide acetyltransferase)|uniref:Dihydrolipoamide acetyltransferase component of pyruvate dehydrogenase complex n=1 Tax=Candidatus Thermofonsia Clade 3 bacterium TaxID=2364212 RepID=A0A2M8QGM4_9CHLR|nr:dihydrolipoamide acetyltransferase family protein [Candidatus Roseilinea sp. NK_OTU-006]PJF48963.1 MAG: 2-oxo acid dehydrogenase subunit E2 [Candidatus Thermofonsia Clade 3 bacterium]RMG62611.1 MAG: 2-oxo acid dehydrogenase subunit E2 [Chloroflexota bacterium]